MPQVACHPDIGKTLPAAWPRTPEAERESVLLNQAAKDCPKGALDLEYLAAVVGCDAESVKHGLISLHEQGLVALGFNWCCPNSEQPGSKLIMRVEQLEDLPIDTACPHCRQHHLLNSHDVFMQFFVIPQATDEPNGTGGAAV